MPTHLETRQDEVARRSTHPVAYVPLRERARLKCGTVELLMFRVGDQRFGVELTVVEEAIDMPAVHHVPEMPPCMIGVMPHRGLLAAVYSPEQVLGLTLATGACALVFRRSRGQLAVAVDEIDDAESINLAELRETPDGEGVVLGVVRLEQILVVILDAGALIEACQTTATLETA